MVRKLSDADERNWRQFPDSPAIKTPHFLCQGHRFSVWLGNSYPASHMVDQKQNKTKKNWRWHKQMVRCTVLGFKESILLKWLYCTRDLQFQCKSPMTFSTELEYKIFKCLWKHKRTWTTKTILRKKNQARGIMLSDFRRYYKATVIKTDGTGTKTDI